MTAAQTAIFAVQTQATAKERRHEMESFLERFPAATSSQVVDHMMEKFEGTKRSTHRGMPQRVARPAATTPTQQRQDRVLALYDPLKPMTQKKMLKTIQKEFPDTEDAPTLAMIHQVFRADGDHERYPQYMTKLFARATCPTCDIVAEGVDEIHKHFGFREQNKRRQSYCRKCRKGHAKQMRAKKAGGSK
jgi:hypothetical protein